MAYALGGEPIPNMPPSLPPKPAPAPPDPAPASRPWRTEGLPPEQQDPEKPKPRINWVRFITGALLIYAVAFLFLTVQDRMNGPHAISYTEFDKQVEAANI